MLLSSAGIILGILVLAWSADRFVLGASEIAKLLGISPLVIGLTIIGFGTSAPEMLISAIAAYTGAPGLAVGNAVGSNIANIGLVLGTSALIAPLAVHSQILRREYPVMVLAMLLALMLCLDGELTRIDGMILLGSVVILLIATVRLAARQQKHQRKERAKDALSQEFEDQLAAEPSMSMGKSIFTLVLGLILLLVSSRVLVWGATNVATYFGVSDLVIGLTVVAIGTSLPELAAAVAATLKNEHDLTIGNVVGSNIFNMLAVLGVPGLITTTTVSREVLIRDFPTMLFLTLIMLILASGKNARIGRIGGGVLLLGYVAYLTYLGYTAQG